MEMLFILTGGCQLVFSVCFINTCGAAIFFDKSSRSNKKLELINRITLLEMKVSGVTEQRDRMLHGTFQIIKTLEGGKTYLPKPVL